jgi:RNA polymerase II subunit A C-terminal domain phosphatase
VFPLFRSICSQVFMELASVRLPLRVIADAAGWTLSSWLVPPGSMVHRNQRVASLQSPLTGAVDHALAPHSGRLVRTFVVEGAVVSVKLATPGDLAIAEIEYCPHSVVFSGLCAVCGEEAAIGHFADVQSSSSSRLPVAYDAKRLSVTRAEAENIAFVTAQQLLLRRRLSLVLDLDHTLLHATDDPRAAAVLDHSPEGVDMSSIHSFALAPCDPNYPQTLCNKMHVKLRPHLGEFLSRCAELFELHIYTMGSRPYADRIAQIIDPDKRLFRGRVTSREDFDDGRSNQKNISRLFPCDDSMVLIIDDREDVWVSGTGALFMPNLIRAKPYTFWNGLHEAYNRVLAPGPPGSNGLTANDVTGSSDSQLLLGPTTSVLVRPPTPEVNVSEKIRPRNKDGDNMPDILPDGPCSASGTIRVVAEEPMPALSEELRRLVGEWWENDSSIDKGSHHLRQLVEVLETCHAKFFEHLPQSPKELEPVDADVKEKKSLPNALTNAFFAKDSRCVNVTKTMSIPADVKDILADIRVNILKGCALTFTGVIPLFARPEDSTIWQLAVRHGAECTREFVLGKTTHVIASADRGIATEKVRLAVESGTAFCVDVKWLEDCTVHFEVRPELLYSLHLPGHVQSWEEYREAVTHAHCKAREAVALHMATVPLAGVPVVNSEAVESESDSQTNQICCKRGRRQNSADKVNVSRTKLARAGTHGRARETMTHCERVLGDDELDDALDAALEYASDS